METGPSNKVTIKFKINETEDYSITILSDETLTLNDAISLRSRLDRLVKLFKDEVDFTAPEPQKRPYVKRKIGKRDFTGLRDQDLIILQSVAKDKTMTLQEKRTQINIILHAYEMADIPESDSSIKDAIYIKIPKELKRRGITS